MATKKTPAKKPAVKAPVTHRTDYKPGARVKVQRRTGEDKGFVTGVKQGPTGHFIVINVGTKQKPVIHEARPAKVRGY